MNSLTHSSPVPSSRFLTSVWLLSLLLLSLSSRSKNANMIFSDLVGLCLVARPSSLEHSYLVSRVSAFLPPIFSFCLPGPCLSASIPSFRGPQHSLLHLLPYVPLPPSTASAGGPTAPCLPAMPQACVKWPPQTSPIQHTLNTRLVSSPHGLLCSPEWKTAPIAT